MFALVASENWVIVTDDFADNDLAQKWAASVKNAGHPTESLGEEWLNLHVNPSILGKELKLPVIGVVDEFELAMSWLGKDIRTVVDARLSEPFPSEFDDWKTPKKVVMDPLVSFTAVRGAKRWLGSFGATKDLPDDLQSSQLFNWTRGDVSLVSDFAAPVADANKAYGLLKKNVPDAYGEIISDYALGKWVNATNIARTLWRGLPVFVPYFEPLTLGENDYIKGGVFPVVGQAQSKPAPSALYEQFESRDNLFYYDWEITVARVSAFNQAQRFLNLFLPLAPRKDPSYAVPLMLEVVSKLQNAVTEGTVTGQNSVRFVRKSGLGFTGVELWLLTHWLDNEQFPEFPYSAPPKRGLQNAPNTEESFPRAKSVTR